MDSYNLHENQAGFAVGKMIVAVVDNCQLVDAVEAADPMYLSGGTVAEYYGFGSEKEPVAAEVAD